MMPRRPLTSDEVNEILTWTDEKKQCTPFPNEVSPKDFTEIQIIAQQVIRELKIEANIAQDLENTKRVLDE